MSWWFTAAYWASLAAFWTAWYTLIYRPDRRRRRRLPRSKADVPILAYKSAALDLRNGRFLALTNDGGYGVDADARCGMGHRHKSPDLHCRCGFYAMRNADAVVPFGVLLEVELSGRVVVHEDGYRAGHQRVLHIWLGRCGQCMIAAATAVWHRADARWEPLCERCEMSRFDAEIWGQSYTPAHVAEQMGVPCTAGKPPMTTDGPSGRE